MTQLLAIILAIMTWTVDSKSAVHGSGDIPTGVSATYECSYQKGTVRKGDEAVLQLTGMRSVTVTQINVWVRSNKDAGAGTFTVSAEGSVMATKSGSLKDWVGAFDNTNYRDVALWSGSKSGADEWVIRLVGTDNSLYIDRYVITYTPAPCYTVRLMQGSTIAGELTETKGGAGVLLPLLNDTLGWRFKGWSDHEFWSTTTIPDIIPAGTRWYPTEDMTLWSVYAYEPAAKGAVTELTDGDYLYVNTNQNYALAGTPTGGEMSFAFIDQSDEALFYTMVFTPSRDSVYLTHKQTNTPIGYNSQAQMAATPSPWLVYHKDEQTALYVTINGKTYILWLNIYDKTLTYLCAGLFRTSDVTSATMMQLLYPADAEPTTYTCHPENPEGLDELTSEGMNELTNECVVQIGIYELHIRNGKKYIKISELAN